MSKQFLTFLFLSVMSLSIYSGNLSAQNQPAEPPPAISVSASSEVKVTPDRATISIAVQTQHEAAASAADENARKQTAVMSALKGLGLTDKEISTVGYRVSPSYRYEQNRQPILTGYTVTNTIVVELSDIKKVGDVLDAALKAGANNISSLNFFASDTRQARQSAIADAIRKAREEAQIAAQAAGGSISGPLEITVNQDRMPMPMYARAEVMGAAAADVSTPINPGDQSVVVTVYTRWRFVPAQ